MWKVFGEEGVLVQFETLWIQRMTDFSKRRKDRVRFLALLDQSEITYHTDIHQEMHVFTMALPTSCTADDVKFLRTYIQRIIKTVEYPMVELDGKEQRAVMIITADRDEDDHKSRMSTWHKMLEEDDRQGKK